ncbi:YpuI family protein [Bacillus salitolerans]|uniref:YpuI family protein n=1 Tax=Bacillus salitolerans TaxID=1437434 RepID=A0ABW4LV89_9BACI
MGNTIVQNQLKQVESFLQDTVTLISAYLDDTTISSLQSELNSTTNGDYCKLLLSGLRRLVVFCEEGLDACQVVLRNEPFRKPAAEKTLYKIYHQCIEEFFSPKNDVWHENSRSAYTGKNAIKFAEEAPSSTQLLFSKLEGKFQGVREELEYYETDYRTKMAQS